MTDPLFDTSDGTTPIDEDEAEGLRLVQTGGHLVHHRLHHQDDADRAVRSLGVEIWPPFRRLGPTGGGDGEGDEGLTAGAGRSVGGEQRGLRTVVEARLRRSGVLSR